MNGVLGLDIGGANLKAAHSSGAACSRPFPLWKQPDQLSEALRQTAPALPSFDRLAVTMTGELCDCYGTKREGVGAILDAVESAFPGVPLAVWRTDGRFANAENARQTPLLTAAANWHVLATYVSRFTDNQPSLLIDVGSTTTDVIPLIDGRPVPRGLTDQERLTTGELVYTGARRTPLCALMEAYFAAEYFATTLDVYLLLGWVPEDPADCDTADGRPATREAAHARVARMLCGDAETVDYRKAALLARQVHKRQRNLLMGGMTLVLASMPAPPKMLILAGSGEWLARRALIGRFVRKGVNVISLAEEIGASQSAAACAFAAATLAAENC